MHAYRRHVKVLSGTVFKLPLKVVSIYNRIQSFKHKPSEIGEQITYLASLSQYEQRVLLYVGSVCKC